MDTVAEAEQWKVWSFMEIAWLKLEERKNKH